MENIKQEPEETPYDKETEKAAWRERTYIELVEELETHPAIIKFREQYSESSVREFIQQYANQKLSLLEWGPIYEKWNEDEAIKWINLAKEGLEQIQQKKLFDLQCLWRAGRIDLEGVQICMDFDMLERKVMDCRLIPPITPDEVELYIQYLRSTNIDRLDFSWIQWQDYENLKEAYNTDNENTNFPEWYDFYNGRKGTGFYLQLPDMRGEKEKYYRHLYHNDPIVQHEIEVEKKKQPKIKVDDRERINDFDEDWLEWFVETFEDEKTQELAEKANAFRSVWDTDFDWMFDKEILSGTDEPIPVLPWHDWKESLHRAADLYQRTKIIQAMPTAYEEYLMWRNAGIPFEKEKDKRFDKVMVEMRAKTIEKIIQGRIMNGEPGDLNY